MTFGVWSKTANHVRAFCLPVWWVQVSLWPKQIFKTLVLHKGHLLYLPLISGSLWITSPRHRGAMHWYHPLDGTQFGSVRNVQMFSIWKLERFFLKYIFPKIDDVIISQHILTAWPSAHTIPLPFWQQVMTWDITQPPPLPQLLLELQRCQGQLHHHRGLWRARRLERRHPTLWCQLPDLPNFKFDHIYI